MTVAGTKNVRLLRRTLAMAVIAVSCLVVSSPMAGADPCPPLDLGCTVGDVGSTVGGAVEATTTTVGGVVEEANTTIGGVVEDATTTVGGVVEDATTTVGGVLEGVGQGDVGPGLDGVVPGVNLPGGGGLLPGPAALPPGGGSTPPVIETEPPDGGGAPGTGGTQVGRPSSGSHDQPAVVVAGPRPDHVAPATSGGISRATEPRPTSPLDNRRGTPMLIGAGLIRTLALPLALVLLAIGFAFVQNRIDRKDPKLALAPVSPDYLTFS